MRREVWSAPMSSVTVTERSYSRAITRIAVAAASVDGKWGCRDTCPMGTIVPYDCIERDCVERE